MMWTASVNISSKIAPKGWKTATMTIISAFLSCLGGGTGALAGGYIAQKYSFIFMFALSNQGQIYFEGSEMACTLFGPNASTAMEVLMHCLYHPIIL